MTKILRPSATTEVVAMALQYLRLRRLRTALTTLAVVLGVALMFSLNLVLPSAYGAFFRTMMTAADAADLTVTSATDAFDPSTPMAAIEAVPGVKAVSPVLRRQVGLGDQESGTGASYLLAQFELTGLDPATVAAVHPYSVSEGRFLQAGETGAALLPSWLAATADLQVGGSFSLATTSGLRLFTIVGLFADDVTEEAPRVLVTLADAQAVLNLPGMANTIEVAVEPGADRQGVLDAVTATLGSSFSVNSELSQMDTFVPLELGYAVLDLFGLIALFMAAFLIFNTFRTVVAERRRDLALLRAIGATRRQVTGMILAEGLVQGVAGTAAGLVLGCLLAQLLVSSLGGLYSQFRSGADFRLTFNLPALLISIAAGVLTAVAASYLPARAAARVSPLEALRPVTIGAQRRTARTSAMVGAVLVALAVAMLAASSATAPLGAIVLLIGIVVAAPALVWPVAKVLGPLLTLWFAREGELARGNLSRHPGRAAVTAGTLMVGLATLILLASLVSGMDGLMTGLANRNFASDAMFVPGSVVSYDSVIGADAGLIEDVRGLEGVALATSLRYTTTTAAGSRVQVLGVDPMAYPQVAGLQFSRGDGAAAFPALAEGRNAIVNSLSAKTLGVEPGSNVTLETAEGQREYRVVAVGDDLLNFKIVGMLISQANLEADFHKTEDVMLMVNYMPGAERGVTLAGLRALAASYPQFTVHDTGDYRSTILEMATGALSIFYGLAVLILIPAALGLLNTLAISVIERTREIGTIRAIGASRSQVKRIVTAEALLLGLFGAAMGVLAGVAMSYGFVQAFSLVGWALPYDLPLGAIVVSLIVAIVLALLAAVVPARNAARLDIIRALQYE